MLIDWANVSWVYVGAGGAATAGRSGGRRGLAAAQPIGLHPTDPMMFSRTCERRRGQPARVRGRIAHAG